MREPPAPEQESTDAWEIPLGGPVYPRQLAVHPQSADWPIVYGVGNRDILKQNCLGLICSVQCPGSVMIKTFDAIRELRDAGIVIAGGFHSPMEQDCLEFLLRGEQPVVVCPAKNPAYVRPPATWQSALEAGRLVLVSPFGEDVRRMTRARAKSRNEFVSALATAVLIPHASSGGNAAAIARQITRQGRPLFTTDDEVNSGLVGWGAWLYSVDRIRQCVTDIGSCKDP
jgi:predicted Rossmann fold nucleotide-binding protein DprA/Smf involved in DNA uptake